MKKSILLASLALSIGVGCAGNKQRVTALEGELTACRDAKTQLQTENAGLQEQNAQLQVVADKNAQIAADRKRIFDDLQAALLESIDAGTLNVVIRNGVVVVQLPNDLLFDSRTAKVKKDAKATIVQVANALKNMDGSRFYVAGHTDSQSVKEKKARRFDDNWDLATQRAYNVHQILIAAGLRDESTAVAAFGQTDPVADNSTEEGRALNRRIEVMVIPDLAQVLPGVDEAAPGTAPADAEEGDDTEAGEVEDGGAEATDETDET